MARWCAGNTTGEANKTRLIMALSKAYEKTNDLYKALDVCERLSDYDKSNYVSKRITQLKIKLAESKKQTIKGW